MFDLFADFPSRAHRRWLRRYWLPLLAQAVFGALFAWALLTVVILAWGG
jgi:hypothetical protein